MRLQMVPTSVNVLHWSPSRFKRHLAMSVTRHPSPPPLTAWPHGQDIYEEKVSALTSAHNSQVFHSAWSLWN